MDQEQEDILEEAIWNAKILWSIATVEHDLDYLASDDAASLFPEMFSDSRIAAGFKDYSMDTSYMINDVIAATYLEKLKEKLFNNTFSILIAESFICGELYLCIMVQYYDDELQSSQVKYLDVKQCNKSNADDTNLVIECFEEHNLSFDHLIQIVNYSCSAMGVGHKCVVSQLKNKYAKHAIDIGGCSLHHVTNSHEHALYELFHYGYLEEFVQDISMLFSINLEFAEELEDLQNILDINQQRLVRFSYVSFLSMYPVVNRLLEDYQALKNIFTDDLPNNHPAINEQPQVHRINESLKSIYTLPSLYFIQFILEIFQKYEILFLKDEPTIHLIYDKQFDLFRNTLKQFCRFELIEKLKNEELVKFDFKSTKNILAMDKINVGIKAKEIILKFSKSERDVFLHGIRKYYIRLCDNFLKDLSLTNNFWDNLRFLKPEFKSIDNKKRILNCAKLLPPGAKFLYKELNILATEWKTFMLEYIPKKWYMNESQNLIPIDKYWSKVMKMKGNDNETKYPVISKVIKCCFSIAEANEGVEKKISQIFQNLQKYCNRLSLDRVKGILYCKEVCTEVKIDNRLICKVKIAHASNMASKQANKQN